MNQKRYQKMVKSGMTIAMVATALTGFRILRPMKLHPVAGTVFLAFTLAHLLMNRGISRRKEDHPNKRG